jgi:oligopeptide/dipeptide ABC transporter ATP-binding protein
MKELLHIEDLRTYFFTEQGTVRAVDGVDISVNTSQTIGLVGESGCGKSMTALSILGLVPSPPGRIVSGKILFEGYDLLTLGEAELQKIRGNRISMVFQEPMTSLNPVFTVGEQIAEVFCYHTDLPKRERRLRAVDILKQVGIPSPERRFFDYPHQLSGGMRQRVMIAMALSLSPRLLIADEPTTALDVTIQAQILELIDELRKEHTMSMILITHDLGVVSEVAERLFVMYAGTIVEASPVKYIFDSPLHPYTQGLLKALPALGSGGKSLYTIPGSVPRLSEIPAGCRFSPRCPYVLDICKNEEPPMFQQDGAALVKCWLFR